MPRGPKRTNDEKIALLQSKIDTHKKQIANLEKQKATALKAVHTEAANELVSFMERKNLSVTEVKRLVNHSLRSSAHAAAAVSNIQANA